MECDALILRIPSSKVFRLFPPDYKKSICSRKLLDKPQAHIASSLLSNRVKLPVCAADSATKLNQTRNFPPFDSRFSPFQLHEGPGKTPRNLSSPNRPFGNRIGTNEVKRVRLKGKEASNSEMLPECASRGALIQGKEVHGAMIRSGIEPDSNLRVSLNDMHAKRGSSDLARKVFDEMCERDIVSSKDASKRYSGMLREFTSKGALIQGKGVHGVVIRSGIELDSEFWVSLINFYAKCESLELACKVFDEMSERDVVSWAALIAGYVNAGLGNDAVRLYSEMRKENVLPNEFALATLLKACSIYSNVDFGKQIHTEAIKARLLSNSYVGSGLVGFYAKRGKVELAERVFFGMPEKNIVSWNVLLNGYSRRGAGKEALNLFCQMTESETNFDKFTLSTVVKTCAKSGFLREGKVLHSLAIRSGCNDSEVLIWNLIAMYSKCGIISDALKVFETVKNPDVAAWIISRLNQQGLSKEAIDLFHQMRHAGVRPNQYSIASIVNAATNISDIRFGRCVHCFAYKYGLQFDKSIGNELIMMYEKIGSVKDSVRVFESMEDRDLFSWNSLVYGFHNNGNFHEGLKIFCKMLTEGYKPDKYTFISVLRSCSFLDAHLGRQVHAHVIKNGLNSHVFVGTAVIDMYAKTGVIEDADVAFSRLKTRDAFTWTVLISAHAQSKQAEKAMKYFGQMLREGVKLNEFTLASGLRGCSRMATLINGQQLHSLAIKSGHQNDVFVTSSLVGMYRKCGCLKDAIALFETLTLRDLVSWNIVIDAYSQHGQGRKALEAFETMVNDGIAPDGFTFLRILAACSYTGLVEEGRMFLDSMSEKYGISPSIEHYTCMVDILGRSGKFDEIENFIEEMKLTSYSVIWETILGACKLHGNDKLGKKAAEKLFELEPDMDSSYILP